MRRDQQLGLWGRPFDIPRPPTAHILLDLPQQIAPGSFEGVVAEDGVSRGLCLVQLAASGCQQPLPCAARL